MNKTILNIPPSPERPLLNDEAYAIIKQSILDETLEPGSFLSERKLALSMNLGIAPVRRAFQRLAGEGFLKISPRQGAMVTDIVVNEVLDLYELRKVLECFVVRKIAGKLTDAEINALQENLTAQTKAAEAKDLPATVQLDMAFHALLCSASRNKEIQTVMQQLRDKVYRIIVRSVKLLPDRTRTSTNEHRKILSAIIAGDADKAAEWMEKHMDFGKRFVLLR